MTATTQEERTLGGLVHLGVLFGWIGLAFQIVLLVVYLPKSKYVAGHVKQALGLWTTWFLVRLVVGAATGTAGAVFALNPARLLSAGFIGSVLIGMMIMSLLAVGVLVLVILAMIKGFNGEPHKYPIIGDLVDSIAR